MTVVPGTPVADTESTPRKNALTFDAQEFCHFLADTDWTDEQKREFIEVLWQIVVGFVDLGFDLHPVQQVIDSPKTLEVDSSAVIDSDHQEFFEKNNSVLADAACAGGPDS